VNLIYLLFRSFQSHNIQAKRPVSNLYGTVYSNRMGQTPQKYMDGESLVEGNEGYDGARI
jgi:hypothetical protein